MSMTMASEELTSLVAVPTFDLTTLEDGLEQDPHNAGGEFEVQKIVDERVKNGVVFYKIRWRGYTKEEDTWEPKDHLNGCDALLEKWRTKVERKRQKALAKEKVEKQKPIERRPKQQFDIKDSEETKRRKRSNSATDSNSSKALRLSPLNSSSSLINSPKIELAGSGPRSTNSGTELCHPDSLKFQEKLNKIPGPQVTLVNDVDDTPCPPLSFAFINEHIIREGVPVPDKDAMWGCSCTGAYGCPVTRPEECACTDSCDPENRQFAYRHTGKLRLVDNSQFAIHECNERCACNWRCPNKVTFNGRKLPIEIFKTKNKGWGLRCPVPIPAGTFIDKYIGEVITPEEAERRMAINDTRGLSYLFDLDKFKFDNDHPDRPQPSRIYTVDGADYGGITRFINHSCDPNLLIYAVTHNRSTLDVYDIALFSRRDIEPMEELTFQYTHSEEDDAEEAEQKEKGWPCFCGAENCKGYLW